MNKIDYYAAQSIGKRREQQDMYRIYNADTKSHLVCLLADGMGGHNGGAIAAQLAVDRFCEEANTLGQPVYPTFLSSLNHSNQAIAQGVQDNPNLQGMGSTFIAVELVGAEYHWVSVGDSLILHYSKGQLARINADHSMASEIDASAERGEISWEEAKNAPSRHILQSALTGKPISKVDLSSKPVALKEEDWLIIASDGIETLSRDEIIEIIDGAKDCSTKLTTALLQAVEDKAMPRQDNITAICIRLAL